jgi:glycosyltransferase involved in cell wall biosynthesis
MYDKGVSFVITIYNKSAYIHKLVEGLHNQSGGFDREFIFVNDGSTDDSLEKLYLETKLLKNVIILNQANQGPSIATNAGISHAKYKYIKFVDGDDYLLPYATDILLKELIKNNCGAAFGKRENSYISNHALSSYEVKFFKDHIKEAIKSHICAGASNSLVRTDLLKKVGGCNERIFTQDYPLTLKLAKETNFIYVDLVTDCNLSLVNHRISSNKNQETYDITLAKYLFLLDNKDLDYSDKKFLLKKATGRAWLWERRNNGKLCSSKYFLPFIFSRIPFLKFSDEFILNEIKKTLELYDNGKIRKLYKI